MAKRIYTTEQIEKIKQLGYKGIPDGEIAEITGVKSTFVGKITTEIWKDLMERKNKKQ